MKQKRKTLRELIEEGRLFTENDGDVVEIHSVEELRELLRHTVENETMLSVLLEVRDDGQ